MAVKYKDLLGPFEELWGVLKMLNPKGTHLKKINK